MSNDNCRKVKIGVIGIGNIGSVHTNALYSGKVRNAILGALCDINEKKREELSSLYPDIPVYATAEELIASGDVEAVIISTPHYYHPIIAIKAFEAGLHVLSEKPMAVYCLAAKEMIKAAKKAGKVLLEAMRPDFDGAVELIRAELDKIGPVRRASFDYCQYSSRYDKFKAGEVLNAFEPKMKNSALADIGIYPLHTCINLFGEPSSVTGRSVFLENGFEAAGCVVMTYPGMLATVNYSKITDNVTPSVIEGERGVILIDRINGTDNITVSLRTGESYRLDYKACPNNMHLEVIAFCDMIQGTISNEYHLSVSEKTMQCVEKIYATAGIRF